MTKKLHWCDRTLVTNPAFFAVCVDEKVFQAELKKMEIPRDDWPRFMGGPNAHATAHSFEHEDGRLIFIVTIRDWEEYSGIEVAALLVHEAVHIWQKVRERFGEREPSSEFEAYSIQHISQELMLSFAKATGKMK